MDHTFLQSQGSPKIWFMVAKDSWGRWRYWAHTQPSVGHLSHMNAPSCGAKALPIRPLFRGRRRHPGPLTSLGSYIALCRSIVSGVRRNGPLGTQINYIYLKLRHLMCLLHNVKHHVTFSSQIFHVLTSHGLGRHTLCDIDFLYRYIVCSSVKGCIVWLYSTLCSYDM